MTQDSIGNHLIQATNQAFPDDSLGGDVATEVTRSGILTRSDTAGYQRPVLDKGAERLRTKRKNSPVQIQISIQKH